VKSTGVEVHSSGDLIQVFEAAWNDATWQMHLEATSTRRPPTTWRGR